MKKASELYPVVKKFFDDDDWRYEELPVENQTPKIIRADFQGENGVWRCYAEVHEEQHIVIFYSILDTRIPEKRRPAVAEFLVRANYGLMIGNFEMDFADGETRYKTSINVEGDRLSTALMKMLVYVNLATFNRYLLGIMQVAYGDKKPEEAIIIVENPTDPGSSASSSN